MSPKWTRTKIVIEITLLLQAILVYCWYRQSTGSCEWALKFSLKLALFSLFMAIENYFQSCSCLYFHDLGYDNMKWLILVEVIWLAHGAGVKVNFGVY